MRFFYPPSNLPVVSSRSFTDQCGNNITLPNPPRRIVSLVPSQTELLCDLGLDIEIVGITRFCIHPAHWRFQKTIVGGTKKFRFEVIDRLQPDLIIGNKEENDKESIEVLAERYPIWVSDIVTLSDAYAMIRSVGDMTNRADKATQIIHSIEEAFRSLKKRPAKKVLYLIWKNPWMGVGAKTFIHSMLETMGFQNVLLHKPRYPELSNEEMIALAPEVILLSSEPYPFKEKHQEELQALFPMSKIMLVDGEMFSWYGSRLIQAPAYFNRLVFE